MNLRKLCLALVILGCAASAASAQSRAKLIEEIIARANNEIISNSELERARNTLRNEIRDDCKACTPQEIQAQFAEREKNLLRDLIDQSLLVQKCKDLGINVESDVIKRMDSVRISNNLPDMEALEKAVSQTGMNFEDFKNDIRRGLCTQQVIRQEVSREVKIAPAEVAEFYEKNKKDFDRPEMVLLSEIFISTVGKKEEEIPELEKKLRSYLDRVRAGEDFNVLAEHYSEGSTAKEGGSLGEFQRGQLSKDYEEIVFKLKKGQMTDVIRSQTGFLIMRVDEHYDAGIQPLEKVEGMIQNAIYQQKVQPAMRAYLNHLREESFVQVKAGFTDTAGIASSIITEVQPVTEDEKNKKKKDKKENEEKKDAKKDANKVPAPAKPSR